MELCGKEGWDYVTKRSGRTNSRLERRDVKEGLYVGMRNKDKVRGHQENESG